MSVWTFASQLKIRTQVKDQLVTGHTTIIGTEYKRLLIIYYVVLI